MKKLIPLLLSLLLLCGCSLIDTDRFRYALHAESSLDENYDIGGGYVYSRRLSTEYNIVSADGELLILEDPNVPHGGMLPAYAEGVCDLDGSIIIPCEYCYVETVGDKIKCGLGGSYDYFDRSGRLIENSAERSKYGGSDIDDAPECSKLIMEYSHREKHCAALFDEDGRLLFPELPLPDGGEKEKDIDRFSGSLDDAERLYDESVCFDDIYWYDPAEQIAIAKKADRVVYARQDGTVIFTLPECDTSAAEGEYGGGMTSTDANGTSVSLYEFTAKIGGASGIGLRGGASGLVYGFKDGMCAMPKITDGGVYYGVTDSFGEQLIPSDYAELDYMQDGLWLGSRDGGLWLCDAFDGTCRRLPFSPDSLASRSGTTLIIKDSSAAEHMVTCVYTLEK